MKKILSVFLAVVMIALTVLPAFAFEGSIQFPCIYIHGNAGPIVDGDGNQVYDFDVSTDQILDICKTVLPQFGKAVLTGKYDEYYDCFESEIAKLYEKCSLDKEGNPKYGTHRKESNWNSNLVNRYNNGYSISSYTFCPDWRLDPLQNADLMDTFIDDIMKVTGKNKVCLASDCLGSVNILAYLGKYGHDKIYAVGLLDPVGFGCELVEDTFSGHIDLNPDAIERFLNDRFVERLVPPEFTTILELVNTSITLANDTGILDGATDLFMKLLYDRLKGELVPRLAMATYGTWLSYWGLVSAGRYEETRDFVFGKPGSERYDEYSVLIEKLDAYDRVVRQRIPELLTSAKEDGVKIAIVAKYGMQMPCVLEGADRQGDVWVSLNYATLGATCAPVGETLSDEYIAEREALGYGKYISPDHIVDMSTCLFPDNTWIIKNRIHDQGGPDNQLIENVFAGDNITIANSDYPQFIVYNDATGTSVPMTEENCHTESWYTEPVESKGIFFDLVAKVRNFFNNVKKWFLLVYEVLDSVKKNSEL